MLSGLINTQEKTMLGIELIRLDGGTQPREGLNEKYIAELVEAIAEGATLPPVDVMYDGSSYWLYDGFHRLAATRHANRASIAATVHQGDQAAAQWESYAANQSHGLRRSQADKERAIRAALKHPSGAQMADNLIAKHLGVSNSTVRKYREEMESTLQIAKSTERTGADGRTINTANIGANRPIAQSPNPQSPTRRYESGLPALDMPMPTAAPVAAAAPVDPWAAAWEKQRFDVLTDRCDRLAAATLTWAAAWTDDKGRTWRDLIDRNPQHANSPFRQELSAECKRRGLTVFEEALAETIRRLFGLLASTPTAELDIATRIAAADEAERQALANPITPADGEKLLTEWTEEDWSNYSAAKSAQTAPPPAPLEVVAVDDTPLPAWVTGEPAPISQSPNLPISDDRLARTQRLIDLYRATIASFDDYGDLIGAYVETLPAQRGLETLLRHLDRQRRLLGGETVPEDWSQWAEVAA